MKVLFILLVFTASLFSSFFVVDNGRIVEIVNEPNSKVQIIGSNGKILKKHKSLHSAKKTKYKKYKSKRVVKKRKKTYKKRRVVKVTKKRVIKKRKVFKKKYSKNRKKIKHRKTKSKIVHKKNKKIKDLIVIRTSKKILEFYKNGRFYKIYPVAVGKRGWRVYGKFWIRKKVKWPDWIPTKKIKEENPRLPDIVYGGPKNPLGARALYLGYSAVRIHGTNNPKSVGKAVSHGCFRMKNKDVIELFNMVKLGTPVYIK